MSYLLDALKKSEAEQDPKAAAALTVYQHRGRRQRLLGGLVAAALVINAAVLLWLFGPRAVDGDADATPPARAAGAEAGVEQVETGVETGGAAGRPVPGRTAAPSEPVAVSEPRPAARDGLPATGPGAPEDPRLTDPVAATRTAQATAEVTAASEAAPATPVSLADLPPAVRARLPGLVFSTHVFAVDPDLRAVVANGQRLLEGDSIDGATIERITESGVALGFEGYLVAIPVIAEWEGAAQ